jgi:hypothetical protein
MNCPCNILSRMNGRLIALLLVVSLPFGWFAWQMASEAVNGGIHRQGDVTLVDLKSLGNFNFDPSRSTFNDVPARYRALDGQRVVLEGFMWSRNGARQARDVEFVYNIENCCFKGPPRVQERVYAHSPVPLRIDSYTYAQLTGVLHVKLDRDELGNVTSVYTLDVENLKYRTM